VVIRCFIYGFRSWCRIGTICMHCCRMFRELHVPGDAAAVCSPPVATSAAHASRRDSSLVPPRLHRTRNGWVIDNAQFSHLMHFYSQGPRLVCAGKTRYSFYRESIPSWLSPKLFRLLHGMELRCSRVAGTSSSNSTSTSDTNPNSSSLDGRWKT
jgi:hypothetical protein